MRSTRFQIAVLGFVLVLALVAVAPTARAVDDTSVHSGLFFTIDNACSDTVSGFAVGDKICLLKIESAWFMRAIFQGDLAAGGSVTGMACTGSDGNATVLFVPPVCSGAQAVEMTVQPNSTVQVPSSFCTPCAGGAESASPQSLLKTEMMDHEGMDHEMMEHEGMDHEGMDHEGMGHEGMGHEGMMDDDKKMDDGGMDG